MRQWLPLLAVVGTPLTLVLALPPLTLWPLAFVALVPYFALVLDRRRSLWSVLLTGGATGAMYWALMNHEFLAGAPHPWLSHLGDAAAWAIAVTTFLALSLLAGLFWVASSLVTRRLAELASPLTPFVGGAVWVSLMVLASQIAGDVDLGLIVGYSIPAVTPFGQVAALGSAWLVSYLLIVVNWQLATHWFSGGSVRALPRGVIILLLTWLVTGSVVWLSSSATSTDAGTVRAVAIQRARLSTSDVGESTTYDQLLLKAQVGQTQPTVIVLPEGAYGIDDEGFMRVEYRPLRTIYRSIAELQAANQQKLLDSSTLVAGFVDTSDQERWLNGSAVSASASSFGETYKRQLVPFGERLLLQRYWPESIRSRYVYATPAAHPQLSSPVGPLATVFCNELLAPGLARRDVANGAVLITAHASNYDVATPLYARWQVRAAQYRAVETGRSVVLASDQTRSAIVRPTGSLVAMADYAGTGFIDGEVPIRTDRTLWVRAAGAWAVGTGLLTIAGLTLVLRRRQP